MRRQRFSRKVNFIGTKKNGSFDSALGRNIETKLQDWSIQDNVTLCSKMMLEVHSDWFFPLKAGDGEHPIRFRLL